MGIKIVPMTIGAAKQFVAQHHRHHAPPQGALWSLGAELDEKLVGVAIVGRPVARMFAQANPKACEVTRLCTDGTRNACSALYSAARRAARELGYTKIITYILESETGVTLRAAGWKMTLRSPGGSWSRPSRSRTSSAPTEPKVRWESSW